MYTCKFSLSLYISADLFQSSSVLDYNCNPPADCSPTIPQTASYCAADFRIEPTLYHLNGVSLIRHRAPQPAELEPPRPC